MLTATRHDFWHLVTEPPQLLSTGTPPPRRATMETAKVLGPHPPTDSPLYFSEARVECYSPGKCLKNSWPWEEYTKVLRRNSIPPTILRSFGRAAETFPASDKGWHGLFVEIPHGPKFLHPKKLARGPGLSLGICLTLLPHPSKQLIGNSVPPPMAYLGLLGPAAALQSWGKSEGGGNWAADGFFRCCHANDGA